MWDRNCFACKAPLDIMIFSFTDGVHQFISDRFDVSIFDNNDCMYKLFSRKRHRVCKACYYNYKEMRKHKNIKNIEQGKFPKLRKSLSQDEVREWFDRLEKYWEDYSRCRNVSG